MLPVMPLAVDISILRPTVVLVAVILLAAIVLHRLNMSALHKRISRLSDRDISWSDFMEELSLPQGSTFNAMIISAWILFAVAFLYLYFLTPAIFPEINYFGIPALASFFLGFAAFGLAAVVLASALIAFSGLPMIYTLYEIPMQRKKLMMFSVLLLIISISSSAYTGTMYPDINSELSRAAFFLAFATLIISQVLLLSPVFGGFREAMR